LEASHDIRIAAPGSSLLSVKNLIWLAHMAFIIRVTVFVRQRGAFSAVDTLAAIQILIVGIVCFLTIMSFRAPSVLVAISKTSVIMLFLYYFLSMLSSVWSSLPLFSLYKSFEYSVLLLSILIALSLERDFNSAEKKVLILATLTLFFGVFLHLKLNNFNLSFSTLHTNQYSATAAMICCYAFGEYFRVDALRKRLFVWLGLIAFFFLVIGTSAASNIAFLCGAIVAFILLGKFVFAGVALWFTALVALSGIYLFDADFGFISDLLAPGKTEAEIASASGRLDILEYYKQRIIGSPFIGYGFGVIETGKGTLRPGLTHNAILSVLVGTGLLGVIFYGTFLMRLGIEFIRARAARAKGSVGGTAALTAGLINSLAIPMVADYWMEPSFAFCCFLGLFIWHTILVELKGRQKAGFGFQEPSQMGYNATTYQGAR
jgi:O-antigen ligase